MTRNSPTTERHRFTCQGCSAEFSVSTARLRQTSARGFVIRFCSKPCMVAQQRATNLREYFNARVDRSSADGCWPWTGTLNVTGYGNGHCNSKRFLSHRLGFELANGPIPDGMEVCHRCDNPRCVRPDHLFLGTHAENMADMSKKGRSARGERNGIAKLTANAAREIRRLVSMGEMKIEIAKRFGVGESVVRSIAKRKRWAHVE